MLKQITSYLPAPSRRIPQIRHFPTGVIRKDAPVVKDTAGANYCHLFPTCVNGRIVVFSAIGNLIKGASGHVIQNMNIIFSLNAKLGLL